MLEQNLQNLPCVAELRLGRLVGVTGPPYRHHVGQQRSGPAQPVVEHGSDVVLHVDDLVEFGMKVVLVASGVIVGTGELTSVVGVYAIPTPEPPVYELVFVEDGLEVLS